MDYERIEAGAIAVGDRVARARTHDFKTVSGIQLHPTAVSIFYGDGRGSRFGGKDRPRRNAKWWREVPDQTS